MRLPPFATAQLWPRRLAFALVLYGGALLWFWPTRRAGWVTDILGLAPRIAEGSSLAGAWTGYGSPVFHPITLGMHYLLWQGAGAMSLVYYFLWVGLHAMTAWLLGESVRTLIRREGWPHARSAGALAAVAFVVYPYAVEAVVWRATLNYLLCAPSLLLACWAAYAYGHVGRRKHLVMSGLGIGFALLCFDLAWIGPVLVAVAAGLGTKRCPFGVARAGTVFGVGAAVLVAYLALKSVVIGTAVGHYGAETHLEASPAVVLPNVWRALTKLVFLTRELSFSAMDALNGTLARVEVYVSATAAALAFFCWWAWRLARRSRRWWITGMLGVGAVVSVLPTANLYFYWILGAENDRYQYFPAVWVIALLAVAWAGIGNKGIRWATAAAALIAYGTFGHRQIRHWAANQQLQAALLNDFPRSPAGDVFVLSAPENFRGTYLFRDANLPYTALEANLSYLRGEAPAGRVRELTTFNQMQPTDSVAAHVNPAGEVELTFRQGGNWFWRGGIGLSDYRDEDVEVKAGLPVRICFVESLAPDATLLYPTGQTWTELSKEGLRRCREIGAQ